MRRCLVMLVLVAALGCAAGCGGSDTASDPKPKPPAQDESGRSGDGRSKEADAKAAHERLVRGLNAICRRGNAEVGRLNAQMGSAAGPSAQAKLFERGLPTVDRGLAAAGRLEVPAQDRAAFDRYIKGVKRNRGLIRRAAAALRSGADPTPIRDALETNRQLRLTAAVDLEADDCGK